MILGLKLACFLLFFRGERLLTSCILIDVHKMDIAFNLASLFPLSRLIISFYFHSLIIFEM